MEIRRATIKDLKDVQKLSLMLFEKEYEEYDKTSDLEWTFGKKGEEYFRYKIEKDNSCTFITIDDGKVVGYLTGGLAKAESYRKLPKYAELENMFVMKEYKNSGVGTELYKKFLEWCKSKGVKKVKVVATAQNTRAIDFYRKHGFKDYAVTLEGDL